MATTTEEQSPTPPQLEICQKCGNSIAHVPYKFNNQTFHAVCLKCNFCGKKLVGKPFITEESKIFCGEQCKADFETIPCSELNANEDTGESDDPSTFDESLLEALESIKESNQELLKLSKGSPLRVPDPDRLTDYPRSSSPDSLNGSRRSSISAISESSLTSEGSAMSFDASGKPQRHILKNPHRSRRRSRNHRHVRWNIPNGTSENDSDTTSLESFDSTSTTSSVYNRARNGIAESRRNWRDFDPPSGSTGLTPARHILSSSYRRTPSPSHSPLHTSAQSRGYGGGVPKLNSNELLGGFKRSPSPLTTTSPPSHSPQHSQDNTTTATHSTPVRHFSESSRLSNSYRYEKGTPNEGSPDRSMQDSFSHDESVQSAFKIPVLKLNESSLPDLDNSTAEDKKKAHIFDFTQSDPSRPKYSDPTTEVIEQHKQTTQPAPVLLNEDDADDYDHLSPLTEEEIAAEKKARALKKAHRAMKKQLRQKQKESKDGKKCELYSDKDIDEALQKIEIEDIHGTKATSPVADIPPRHVLPPKKDLKKTELHKTVNDQAEPDDQNSQSPSHSSQSPPSSSVAQKETKPEPSSSLHPRSSSSQETSDKKVKSPKTTHKPPPVPPKTRRILRQQRDRDGNPVSQQPAAPTVSASLRGKFKPLPSLPESTSSPKQHHQSKATPENSSSLKQNHQSKTKPENSSSPKQNHQSKAKREREMTEKWYFDTGEDQSDLVDDILPPPPEFVIPPPSEFSNGGSQGNTPPDDALSSVSNTTLVADQDEMSNPDTSDSLKQSLPDLVSETARTAQSRDIIDSTKANSFNVSTQPQKNKHSWSVIHSAKTKDCKVEETNTEHQHEVELLQPEISGSDSSLDVQGLKYTQASTGRLVKSLSHDPDTTSSNRSQPQAGHNQQERLNRPQPAKYEVSIEQAFTEGKLVKSSTFTSASHHSPHSRYRRTSEQAAKLAARSDKDGAKLHRTTSSPQRPLRHPKVADQFSREDQHVLDRFYPGGKLPMMKRVIHDTDRSIQAMLAELESDKEGSGDEMRTRKIQHGTCSVCSKVIRTTKELISHDSYRYHSKCYKCAACRSSLRGKKLHRVRNDIVCRDCYPTFGISSTQSSNMRRPDQQVGSYHAYHDLRRVPVASGQITSV